MPPSSSVPEGTRNTELEFALLHEKHEPFCPELAPHLYQLALQPSNLFKNRYCNILPFDASLVSTGAAGYYLNANWVRDEPNAPQQFAPQPFILAQAPSLSTIADFYSAIWTHQVGAVVCLTRLEEGHRIKATQYWPTDTSDVFTLAHWTISMPQEDILLDGAVIRRRIRLELRKSPEDSSVADSMEFTLFHFTAWCDHATPAKIEAFVDLIRLVREVVKDTSRPIIAHCSAGVGRAGTFVASYNLRLLKEQGNTSITPFAMVDWLRTQRYGAVQTHEQYAFIYKASECYDQTVESDRRLENQCPTTSEEDDESDFLRTTQWTFSTTAVVVL